MKKILKVFSFVCFIFMAYMVSAYSADSSLKYTAIIKQKDMPSQAYTVYKKGNMEKIIINKQATYINLTTNESIVYTPQNKTAMKIVSQPTTQSANIMPSNTTINEYKNFTKAGTKKINGYTCTIYKNTSKGIEACISDANGFPMFIKTPQSEMHILNISTDTLDDSEFQIPEGVIILDMKQYIPAK